MFQKIVMLVILMFSLSFPAKSATDMPKRMNVVMATDVNYVVPTVVAMRSIVQNCSGPLCFILFVTQDVAEDKALSSLLQNCTDEERRIKVCLINIAGIEASEGLGADFKGTCETISNKLIALRVLFSKIWETKELPEFNDRGLRDTSEFLWMDSDIVVNQDLWDFYTQLSQLGQPIISANLAFIDRSPDSEGTHYTFGGAVGLVEPPFGHELSARVSGGIVFWNLQKISWMTGNTACSLGYPPRKRGEEIMQYCLRCAKPFCTEEAAMDVLLNLATGDTDAYFFPTTYNCRSAYLKEARRFLDDTELSVTEEARNVLQAIVDSNVAIWHWDYEKKPWTYSSSGQMGSPERLWWNYFYDLMSTFPEFNHVFMSIKARPVFSDFKAENQINLRNLEGIPPVTNDIPNGTTCTLLGKQTVRLYRNPQNPNMWLVRVPVGGRGNRCAIHALGITENGEAQEIIRGYNGRWIDVHDANFWNQMAGILGGPIEIYTALDFGRPDNRNGTLKQVAKYGNGSRAVTRVYARNGHYNALLSEMDPYHIGRFIENVARTKGQDDDPPEAMTQGPALF